MSTSKVEQAIVELISERRDLLRRSSAIESELRRYGVSLVDKDEGTAWSLHVLVAEEASTLKNG